MAAFASLLGLPLSNQWFGSAENASSLNIITTYLQGTTASTGAIRVVDQLDPLRAAPSNASKQDEQIAAFLAKKYRLAASEVEKYVHFAHLAAKAKGLETTLVMAVMSIESNLNAITESSAGAQGLMQVLTAVHLDKLNAYGGEHKAFDPEVNIMIGATILADCIKLGGSIEMGLKCYVGATGPTDGGYGAKVLAEKERIEKARLGVFDFSSNNKILQELGILAAPAPELQSGAMPLTDTNSPNKLNNASATGSAQVNAATAPSTSTPVGNVHAAHSNVLPTALPVTLPAPAVSTAPLYSANTDIHNGATTPTGKQK